jgi:UDP-GlcNAc:undecaprenyl-phosphate GlcNAc-1-phosphate transferase
MSLVIFFGICLLISGIAIRVAISMSRMFGIMDHPGGHKQHDTSTPFVGGVGVMTALVGALSLTNYYFPSVSLEPLDAIALGAGVIFLTGLVDDIWHLHFKTRFLAQALVALSMVFLGGVALDDLGGLVPGIELHLGPLAIPFTVFATIGVINALNMIDGIDGLSGSISLVSLMLTGLVAFLADNYTYVTLAIALMGGVAGFLYFNLRYPRNYRARVFLGDNGSMLLGFLFAWMFIDLSQGEGRAMTPVTALWLFALPLMDTVGVMLRRIWLGKSPFRADRNHLHHLFLRAGFRVSDTVKFLAVIQVLLGLVGIAALWWEVPESMMFAGFLLTFALYFYIIARPWRFVPALRRMNEVLGLPSAQARGIYIGYVRRQDARTLLDILTAELGERREYHLSLHELNAEGQDGHLVYGILELPLHNADASLGDIKSLIDKLRTRLAIWPGLQVRPFLQRNTENDRRVGNRPTGQTNKRNSERRAQQTRPPMQTLRQAEVKAARHHALPV